MTSAIGLEDSRSAQDNSRLRSIWESKTRSREAVTNRVSVAELTDSASQIVERMLLGCHSSIWTTSRLLLKADHTPKTWSDSAPVLAVRTDACRSPN